MRKEKSKGSRGVTYDTVVSLAQALPGVVESTSYGTRALKVRAKLMARLKEDGETLVLRTTFTNRDFLLTTARDVVFLTDHYRNYPWMLIRLPRIGREFLSELLEDAWRQTVPRPLREALAAAPPTSKPARARRRKD